MRIVLLTLLLFGQYTLYSQSSPLQPGYYDGDIPLFLGYNGKTNIVTGYVEIHSDKDMYVCKMFFNGRVIAGDKTQLYYYLYDIDSIEISKGFLEKNSCSKFNLHINQMVLPCSNVMDVEGGPQRIELSEKRAYLEIAIVKVDKQYLYQERNNKMQKAYIVKNDPVAVLKEDKDWIFVEYLKYNNIHKTKGWIPKSSIR